MVTEEIVPKISTSVRFSPDLQQILFSEFPVAPVQSVPLAFLYMLWKIFQSEALF